MVKVDKCLYLVTKKQDTGKTSRGGLGKSTWQLGDSNISSSHFCTENDERSRCFILCFLFIRAYFAFNNPYQQQQYPAGEGEGGGGIEREGESKNSSWRRKFSFWVCLTSFLLALCCGEWVVDRCTVACGVYLLTKRSFILHGNHGMAYFCAEAATG